jgi:hypothetical protein
MDELREKIAELIIKGIRKDPIHAEHISNALGLAGQILTYIKKVGYVQLDPDQSLPPIDGDMLYDLSKGDTGTACNIFVKVMLKAGFRKVKE